MFVTVHTEGSVLLAIRDYYLLSWQARSAAAHTPYGAGTQTNTVTEGGTDVPKEIQ